MNNSIVGGLIGVLALGVGFFGGYLMFAGEPEVNGTGASPTGATFSTQRIAEIVMAPTSVSATSTSIQNTDSNDRIITDAGVSCSGLTTMFGLTSAGLVSYQWVAATSSTAAPTVSVMGSANALALMNVTVATSAASGFTATSTYTSPFARIWNAGSYLVFQTNGTSSAASCLPFVRYIAS